jgi:ubiquinol oxidase
MIRHHKKPENIPDRIALLLTKFLRFFADLFFRKQYMHRAIILETVAAVPGMVAGMWMHLKSLRRMSGGYDHQIKALLDEAENERMHLMTFVEMCKPNLFERLLVLITQAIFWNVYFVMYVFFPKVAHRMVGYFEEEAVRSYTRFLYEIDIGAIKNVPAPKLAIDYWKLDQNATLRDVVVVIRKDEDNHRAYNHVLADL